MTNKKKRGFPTAFTVLFIILILAAGLTYVVPSGKFSRLAYESQSNEFVVTDPNDSVVTFPATQETLDKFKIQLGLNKFVDGVIQKPIAIPDTYTRIEQRPQGPLDIIKAPIEGVFDTVDIMVFVLILGGIIGIINKSF